MTLQDILVDPTIADIVGHYLCGTCDCWRLKLPTICVAVWRARYADWSFSQRALLQILEHNREEESSRAVDSSTDPPPRQRTSTSLQGTLVGCPGDVRLLRHLATGAFGVVYLATAPTNDAARVEHECGEIVVKVIETDFHEEWNGRTRPGRPPYSVHHEYDMLQLFAHRLVVPALFVHSTSKFTFLGLPYYSKKDLVTFLNNLQEANEFIDDFGTCDAVALTYQAAVAVDFIHAHGFVHRDVKLENLLVKSWDGVSLQTVVLVLCDFGHVREAPAPDTCTTLVGTAVYMAPEVWLAGRGLGGYGNAADLYAVGVSLFILVAGETPWPETSDVDAHAVRDDAPLHLIPPGGVRDVVSRLLSRGAQERGTSFQLWSELLHMLF